jgi:hypothetical protein
MPWARIFLYSRAHSIIYNKFFVLDSTGELIGPHSKNWPYWFIIKRFKTALAKLNDPDTRF